MTMFDKIFYGLCAAALIAATFYVGYMTAKVNTRIVVEDEAKIVHYVDGRSATVYWTTTYNAWGFLCEESHTVLWPYVGDISTGWAS